ncbi:type II toxin-antitoxin system HicA family toxin [Candidatus Micrarchaeota archaeon]|nr:type II toxin-antitoxin system HicA family toxin [Candidatus Micrarchaeota archaeon]
MASLRKISGSDCIRILCNKFGFYAVRQKGSHVVLRKETPQGSIGVVVPNHEELKIGTIKDILRKAQISEEKFVVFL